MHDLLNHTIGVTQMFANAAEGNPLDVSTFGEDKVGGDPAGSYAAAAARLKAAVDRPGVMEQMWDMPFGNVPGGVAVSFGTLEIAQHGWDLARATAQDATFDPEVSETALAVARSVPAEQVRVDGVFGAEAAASADAPAHDQLAAFLGREI